MRMAIALLLLTPSDDALARAQAALALASTAAAPAAVSHHNEVSDAYRWSTFRDGDTDCLPLLHQSGVQVGSYRYSTGNYFRLLPGDKWSKESPPIPPPARKTSAAVPQGTDAAIPAWPSRVIRRGSC